MYRRSSAHHLPLTIFGSDAAAADIFYRNLWTLFYCRPTTPLKFSSLASDNSVMMHHLRALTSCLLHVMDDPFVLTIPCQSTNSINFTPTFATTRWLNQLSMFSYLALSIQHHSITSTTLLAAAACQSSNVDIPWQMFAFVINDAKALGENANYFF